ncbi:hypothetical protein TeGR_g1237 [Tetraparma gracilis]|uniref:Tetraspanin n=1 Tax=Tetraparma gracilis TaxID=2962635 RepID=A0ABQ6M4W8_9STRA|nr:hypothetical protein TeGR_g1237 [Tetraparma gracilis]
MGILGTIVGCCKAVSCSRLRSRVRRLTDRQYLIMNNSLILFCSLYQGLAGFGVVMLFNQNLAGTMSGTTEDRQAGTQSYMVQAVLGGFLTILSIVAIRAAIKVNIQMLIVYYWLTLVAVPLLFLFSVASLDFKDLLEGWISHRWHTEGFEFLRKYFCAETFDEDLEEMVDTWDTKCKAPINGGPDWATTDDWCVVEYAATDCLDIREDAEARFMVWMSWLMNINGTVGICEICLLLVSLKLVERTLTLPVIMSSLLDAMNYLVFLPAALCILVGVYLSSHDNLEVKDYWLKFLFFVGGGSMFVLSLIGIFAAREKLRGVLKFYAFSMTLVVGLLGVACASSFIFSWRINQIYSIRGDGKAGEVACRSQLYGCCCCDRAGEENFPDDDLCPEWTREEIIHVIEADYKLAGLVAAISCLFALRASRACWILLANLKSYKCVYL